jgi:large subunit ribosomal protein L35
MWLAVARIQPAASGAATEGSERNRRAARPALQDVLAAPVSILDERRAFRHKSGPPGYKHLISRTPVWSLGLRGESIMPKMKTNRAAAKRFSVSGSGRIRRSKCGAQHNMIGKSRKQRRRLRDQDMVDKAMEGRVKLLLPYG